MEKLTSSSPKNQSLATSQKRKVPQLSLADYTSGTFTEKHRFIEDLFVGLKDYGFIILKDHPVEVSLLTQAYTALEKFFALPTETKKKYMIPQGGGQRGYTPFGKEHAKNSPVMDLKEFWHVGRDLPEGHRYQSIYPPNVWPHEVIEFQAVFQKMYKALDETGKIMLEALTSPLKVPHDYFSKMMSEGNSILRLLHYPPIPDGVDPRCVRAAAHEDINLITILVSATQSGLQLKDRDGSWLDVESDPNTLIVDAGDMLSRITNEVIPSTTHRVINPATSDGKQVSRYSMPFFIHPNPDAILTCIDSCKGEGAIYPDITAQDFLMQRLREIGLI